MRTRRAIRNNNSHARGRNKDVVRNIIDLFRLASNPDMDIRRDIQKIRMDKGWGFDAAELKNK